MQNNNDNVKSQQPVIELKDLSVEINSNNEKKLILNQVSLKIFDQDFVTVIGGNGAGKSTLFNVIAGNLKASSGSLYILGQEMTKKSPEFRAKYLSRVFQDPKMGTAPRMTVLENLAISALRGERRGLKIRNINQYREKFIAESNRIGNGLAEHLDSPTESLSGGQRQALSLLMATLKKPELLLLDEHTSALDPKTSRSLMSLTNELVLENQQTALMITHHMEDALKYGNRLLVMKDGQIVRDLNAEEKSQLEIKDLYEVFE